MSGVGEEELEYESDPEEAKLLLKMRRREASDDEDGEDDVEERDLLSRRTDSKAGIISDYESDGQGAAADYEEDESDIDQVSAGDEGEQEIDEDEQNEHDGYTVERSSGVHHGEVVVVVAETAEEFDADPRRLVGKSAEVQRLNQAEEKKAENEEFAVPIDGELYANDDQPPIDESGREGEKKENEPFAVPTAGAFYMHDDRFRDSAGGRHRRTLGGKKLWESKDNRKWGHDKFEEMTMEETSYDKGRKGPRGRYRGRGKNRGENRGYPQGNKSSNAYNNSNQNNATPKSVRGRGPRRYQPSSQNYREVSTQNRQPGNSAAKSSYASSERASVAASSKNEYDPVSLRKHVVASSLNSASPPFYPSGSSTKESTSYYVQKRDAQLNSVRGKNVVADSIGMEKLYIDESISIPPVKPLSNFQIPPPVSSLVSSTESPQSKIQVRCMTNSSDQTKVPLNQVGRVTPSTQHQNNLERPPVQSRFQPSQVSRSQAFSPPKAALSVSSIDSGEVESLPRTGLVGKGKDNSVQSSDGRSGFPYGGGQVISSGGDRNFPGTPAFLPVMQFGGQHPGGMGVPAVGMAFPGYVAQPQLGMGKSEMTWLPVLASAAGAMGAPYCSPYLTVDGATYQNTSGQTSTLATISSKENNIASKPANELKPSQRLEIANDEFGQRQSKPRRYTEMKFDQ